MNITKLTQCFQQLYQGIWKGRKVEYPFEPLIQEYLDTFIPSSSIERKCPCMKKLKGEGNFPSYFNNDDVILHIIAKFWIWYWPRRNIVVRKNQLFLYCYTKLSLSRRTGNQYLSSWTNLLNNFLSARIDVSIFFSTQKHNLH